MTKLDYKNKSYAIFQEVLNENDCRLALIY